MAQSRKILFMIAAVGVLFASANLLWKSGRAAGSGQVDVPTYHNDNARTGQNLNETVLTTGNVNESKFGKIFTVSVDGYVYAQPLVLSNLSLPKLGTHNVLFVATEHDSLYAFDADSGQVLWHTTFINAKKGITTVPDSDTSCESISPEVGITGTPAIDTATNTMYVVVFTKENGSFVQRLHAISVITGLDVSGSPAVIQATAQGSGAGSQNGKISFNSLEELQRISLLVQNGVVEIGWASYCDDPPFHGWMMSYQETSLQQVGVWNTTPNGSDGGLWASGAGMAGDTEFNTFVATGNGTFDVNQKGIDYGDSIVRLAPGNLSQVADYFTPYNQNTMRLRDYDLGSGEALVLPDQTGGPHVHLLVQAGKSESIYLVDRDNMGGYNPKNNNQIVQYLPTVVGRIFGMPAWWNNSVYFSGAGDVVRQFAFNTTSGLLSSTAVSQSPTAIKYPGATPSISANGNSNGIVWVVDTSAYKSKGPAILHAYNAANLKSELYNTSQNAQRDDPGPAVKFMVPTIANGKVYVGSYHRVSVFGLLP